MSFFETAGAIERHLKKNPFDRNGWQDYYALATSEGRSSTFARDMIAKIKVASAQGMRDNRYDVEEMAHWRNLHGRCLLFESHYVVDSYFQYLEWNRAIEKRFYLPRRKQLKPMIDGFQAILDDEIDLMGISTPPGVGKTTASSFFITMLMGLYPDKFILGSAHSDTLTRSMFEGIYGVIRDNDEYRWQEIFPNVRLQSTNAKDQTINLGRPSRFKTFTTRSIGGSLTGATRASLLLYADDLVSGIEEAMNKDRLDKLWELYTNNLKSRKTGKAKELHVATRWSINDPIGRLQRMYDGNPRARFIVMPALDENDESNFDYKGTDGGFSTAMYHDMRASMDDVSWRCLFMNEPIEREGMVYPEGELRRYYELPDAEPDAILSVCDTKDKGKDFSFLPVIYVYGDDHYVVDAVCDQGVTGKVEARIVNALLQHGVHACRFESNSAGGRIADGVDAQLRGLGGTTHITKRFTKSNKETRIVVNAQWVIDHCLFLDKTRYTGNTDYGTMMRFLTSYSLSAKNPFDDVPDGFAMYAEFAKSFNRPTIEIMRNPLWGAR